LHELSQLTEGSSVFKIGEINRGNNVKQVNSNLWKLAWVRALKELYND